jgi:N-acetylneuraminic acid mutarotase
MLKNLIHALGNVPSGTQMDKRQFLSLAAGVTGVTLLAGCSKDTPSRTKRTREGPIVTEYISQMKNMVAPKISHTYGSMIVYQDKIHTISGTSDYAHHDNRKASTDTHEVLDPNKPLKWTTLEHRLPVPRWDAAAYVHNNKIFVVGGEGPEGRYNNTVFTFDWENGWQSLEEKFPVGIRFATGVVCGGDAYVAGGFIKEPGKERIHNPFIYKLEGSGWKEVAEVKYPNSVGQIAAVDNQIFLLGCAWDGRKDSPEPIQIYNTKSSEPWTTRRLPGWLSAESCFAKNGLIVVHGTLDVKKDENEQLISDGIFEYNTKEDRWSYVKSVKSGLYSLGATYCNIGNTLYTAGDNLYNERAAYKGTINNIQRQQIS